MIRRALLTFVVLAFAALVPAMPAHAATRPALSVVAATVYFDGRSDTDGSGDPLLSGICDEASAPGFSHCGNLELSLTIAGFSAFGGLPSCFETTGDFDCLYGGSVFGDSSAEARITYRCVGDGARFKARDRKVLLGLRNVGGPDSTSVNGYTRNDDDSATVTLRSALITDSLRGACPAVFSEQWGGPAPFGGVALMSVRVEHFRVAFTGNGVVPNATWRSKGSYNAPVALGAQATVPVSFR